MGDWTTAFQSGHEAGHYLEPGVVTLKNGRNAVRGRPKDSPHLDPTALRNRNLV
jgi:hypothetical protein